MKLIANIDRNGGIGKDGKLLVHISEDMQRFKALTMGKTIVMGRKTLESLPGGKPLEGRKNVVLTRNRNYYAEGVTVCHNTDDIADDAIVIGGGEIYSLLIDKCDTAYITRTDIDGDADTFMPELGGEWELTECEEHEGFRFETYVRCKKIVENKQKII